MSFTAILWKDWIVFKSKIVSATLSAIVGPLLYLIAFGWGLGRAVQVNGTGYTAFVIPGIIAMNSMTNSFNFIANDISISRLYGKTFEATMMSPVKIWVFTLAKVTTGALRGLYGAAWILLISLLLHQGFRPDAYFILVLVLNCCVFSAIGFLTGLLIQSHADMSRVSSFIITPMSFLCGTFFPLDRFPLFLQRLFEILPLTQAVNGMRQGFHSVGSWTAPVVLCIYFLALLPLAVHVCRRTE